MKEIKKWDIYELTIDGTQEGNPFKDVTFGAAFKKANKVINIKGFYDGSGKYKVRFMPGIEGEWSVTTTSSIDELSGIEDSFICTAAENNNHGPVDVADRYHFIHRDGTPHLSFGTTCYVWNHQGDKLEKETINTLKTAPFNKMRMCVFPKHYTFNKNEPEYFPFEGSMADGWDFERFNPEFFAHFEWCVDQLKQLNIQADIIIFHPYDKWGFKSMTPEIDDFYLRYLVARLSSFSNVWWSFANEYDLMGDKTTADWDRFFNIVWEEDSYGHLRSIHNCRGFYDHKKPWVTHASVQHSELSHVGEWRDAYNKPVVVDECRYEGNIINNWGNISAHTMVDKFWTGFTNGGYVGHGETYMHPDDVLWWSKGGVLHGDSPDRIAFLKNIMEEDNIKGWSPKKMWGLTNTVSNGDDTIISYVGDNQPATTSYKLEDDCEYKVEIIDTWDMTITALDGTYKGSFNVSLPGKPYMAIRFKKSESVLEEVNMFIDSSKVVFSFSPDHQPIAKVSDGDTLFITTRDAFNNAINRDGDPWDVISKKQPGPNPATGPIYIEGAMPGDTLKVEIIDIRLPEWGMMSISDRAGAMFHKVNGWETRRFAIEDNAIDFDGIKLPLSPMIGVIGVAPAEGEVPDCTPGRHGGNMDTRHICAGSTLYLPVMTPGALFGVGDVHAQMGDGEVCICGLETTAEVEVRISIIKAISEEWPILNSNDRWYTICSAETLDDAAILARDAMFDFISRRTNLKGNSIVMLMSLMADLEISQIVDPLLTVRMGLRRDALPELKF